MHISGLCTVYTESATFIADMKTTNYSLCACHIQHIWRLGLLLAKAGPESLASMYLPSLMYVLLVDHQHAYHLPIIS
jgi:hypothetical protein